MKKRWIEILVGVICVAIVVAILYPVFAQTKNGHQPPHDLTNFKILALAGLVYASDNDDRAPLAEKWVDRLYPYAGNNFRPFVCMHFSRQSDPPKEFGHALFAGIVGQNVVKLPYPESYPFFFDSSNLAKNAVSELHEMRARGKGSVVMIAYADGHVRPCLPLSP